MKPTSQARRKFTAAGIALPLALPVALTLLPATAQAAQTAPSPNEDLMRDHGILRRALLVCQHCASLLRAGKPQDLGEPLHDTALLFEKFGSEYHERAVEERLVFPAVEKAGAAVSRYPALLTLQHERSREFLKYLEDTTRSGKIPEANGGHLADQLDAFDNMYRFHAAHEDTVVFPAWKAMLADAQYGEMMQRFEEAEKQVMGHDGFDEALRNIVGIEKRLGILDLAKQTMPTTCHRMDGGPAC